MDLVQILLLCVVGFSVLVFLFVNSLDSVEESRKNSDDVEQRSGLLCDSDSPIRTWSCAVEYVEENNDHSPIRTWSYAVEDNDDQEEEKGGRKNSDDVEQRSGLLCDSDSPIRTWSCAVEYVEENDDHSPIRTWSYAVEHVEENDDHSPIRTWSCAVEENDDQEEEKGGGADKDGKKLAVSGIFERVGSKEIEETEIYGVSSSEKSNFCGAVLGIDGNNKGEILSSNMDINEEDDKVSDGDLEDWEGIERTELEKIFGKAVVFVGSKDNADRINGDVKLQLYGLQRIALEGVCYGSQPMALKVSARAKWNAWQKLGNMSREMAMEKYINILSEHIPEWKGEGTYMRNIQDTSEDDRRSSLPNKY